MIPLGVCTKQTVRLLWTCCAFIVMNACTQAENAALQVERAEKRIAEYGSDSSSATLIRLRQSAAEAALELSKMCLGAGRACDAISVNLEPGLAEMARAHAGELSIQDVRVIVENDAQRILDIPLSPVLDNRRLAILVSVSHQQHRVSLAEAVN